MQARVNKLYQNTPRHIYAAAFSAIELTLICLILFSSLPTIAVCYSAIVVAFLFALPFLNANLKENVYILAALFLTLVADFFLVIEYGITGQYVYQCLGVSAFCAVHFFYFLYLYKERGKGRFLLRLLIRLFISLTAAEVSGIILKENSNFLSVASVVCFSWLIINIVVSLLSFKKTWLFFSGLLFFALCDLWVGLQNAHNVFFTIPEGVLSSIVFPPFNAVWLCYGLSQTLIVLHLILKNSR